MTTNGTDREPTRGQLLAMAYVDGELAESSRREFESLLRQDPVLVREVAELKALEQLLHRICQTDPVDRRRVMRRSGVRYGSRSSH